jgi:uncharacterized protein
VIHAAISAFGVLFAAIVSGATGLAFPLIAAPIFLVDYAPPQAILITAVCSLIGQLLSLRLLRQTINYEIRWPLILAGLFAGPFGTFALMWCDGRAIRLGMAALLVICGVWQLTGGRLRGFRDVRYSELIIGAFGGICGGMFGASSPVPAIWLSLRRLDKNRQRAILQPYIIAVQCVSLLALLYGGAFVATVGRALAMYLPPLVAGIFVGTSSFRLFSSESYGHAVAGLVIVGGVALLLH